MAKKPLKIDVGVVLKADTASLNKEGELKNKSSKIKTYIGGSEREVVTNDQTQTLENKTIDGTSATGNNTVTTDADQVTYDNSTSSLSATDTQAAIDEVEGRLDTAEGAITTGATNLSNHLADAVDAHDASAISSIASGNLAATDVQSALNELQSDIDTRALASGLSDHLADTSDAHDASAISYDNSSSMLVATDAQAAIDEVEDRLDTAEGDIVTNASVISDHITDATDAHDASAISSVASGNLAATDVQSALNELQSDIDTRALDSALTDHINDATDAHDASAISFDNSSSGLSATTAQAAIDEVEGRVDTTESTLSSHVGASTGVHGVTGVVVGTTDTQTLTNKTITGASIQTPSRLDVKQDTLANLTTYASTASNGQLCFATDTKQMFQVVDSALETVGGGGLDQWVTATDYEVGDVVWLSDDNKIYRCITLNSDVTFTPANWQELSENPYVNNLTVTAQDNLTVTDSVGTRLLKSENYELYYQDFKDVLPSTIFSSTSASLTVSDVTGTEINTSNTMASITQSGASPSDSTEIVLPLPIKKADWILTPIKILEMLEVTGGNGTFGVTLEQSNDGITFTALGSIPQLGSDVSLNKSIVQVNADSTHIKIKLSVIVADDATTLNVHRILISTDAFPVGQISITDNVTYSGYLSRTGTQVRFKTEVQNNSSRVVSVDNVIVTKYTFIKKCSFVATASLERGGSTGGMSSQITLYNSSNAVIHEVETYSVNSVSSTVAMTYEANVGDYILVNSGDPLTDTNSVNFSVSATAYADNVIVEAATSGLNTVNAGTLTISATTTAPTKGTVVTDNVWVVNNMNDTATIRFEFEQSSAGTAGSGDYLFKMPNGYKIDTTKVTPYTTVEGDGLFFQKNKVGTFEMGTANWNGEGSISVYSEDYVRASFIYGNSGNSNSAAFMASASFPLSTSSMFLVGEFTVPIQGRSVDSLPISLDVSSERENVYSARIQNNGTASIISQSSPFIESVSRTATGTTQITLKAGFFTVAPSAVATVDDTSQNFSSAESSVSVVTVVTRLDNSTLIDKDFSVFLQRQIPDYRPQKAYVAGQVALTEARTDGVEYRTNEKVDGQWVYARTVKWTGSTSSTFSLATGLDTSVSVLEIKAMAKNSLGYWIEGDYTTLYNVWLLPTGELQFRRVSDTWVEINSTIKYTK